LQLCKKNGTELQFIKNGLFLKEMKELDCFQKNWDKLAKKQNIWTEL